MAADGPNQVALVVATMLAVFVGWRRGHSLTTYAGIRMPRIPAAQIEAATAGGATTPVHGDTKQN
ncbi:hypothetical protein QFZ89_006931 [Paraburkholderia youngii]